MFKWTLISILSFFVLDLIDKLEYNPDFDNPESIDNLYQYKFHYFDKLMIDTSDLVYYGKMSLSDVDKLTPVDRNYYLKITSDRVEDLSGTLGAMATMLFV